MAYAALLFITCLVFRQNAISTVYVINPKEWLAPEFDWWRLGIILLLILLNIIVMLINDVIIEGRIDG